MDSLSRLIEMAKAVRVSEEQRQEQRRSFVYGNTAMENEEITWEMVARHADAPRAYSDEEAAKRTDATIRAMIGMKPKPHAKPAVPKKSERPSKRAPRKTTP